jgi:hypothetical protein
VVDVSYRPHVHVHLVSYEFLFRHDGVSEKPR